MSVNPVRYPTRLLLQTMYNVRDLGGFATFDGQVTAFGRFLRADAPVNLNREDLKLLLEYPVRTVIDLRSPNEIGTQPHELRDHPDVCYVNIPLLGDDLDAGIAAVQMYEADQQMVGLVDLYIHLLEHAREPMGQVFSQLAATGEGASLSIVHMARIEPA